MSDRRRRPASALLVVVLLAGILVAAVGAGYSMSEPSLGDGSAHLAKGHTVAHVNGESGRSDAELARRLATGTERLQVVRLPDGRLAIVNKETGQVTFIDPGTMTETGPPLARNPDVTAVPTQTDGYLVDHQRGTVEIINPKGGPAPAPVQVPDGIAAAVPAGPAIWVLTKAGEIISIVGGVRSASVRLPGVPQGLTVADSHPVAVTTDGTAYTVDGPQPRAVGQLDVSGPAVVLGAWEGADRHVIGVDSGTARVSALDPRGGRRITVDLPAKVGTAQLAAPVLLGSFAYIPDYSGPALWRVDLARGRADARPLDVHGSPGPFELKVSGGRVWANSQYDRRVLVVERDGTHRYADKGPGAGVTDSQQPGGSSAPSSSSSPSPGPSSSLPPSAGPPRDPAPGAPGPGDGSGPRVAVPAFPRGTPYQRACDRLTELDLRCDPVASGDRPGRATGEVIDTVPGAGSQVPARSRVLVRYVGPTRVPDVVGDPQAEACASLRGAGLVCAPVTDPAPAPTAAQLGVVLRQQPPAGREVAKGTRVTVTYHNTIALPAFTGRAGATACAEVRGLQLRCEVVPGTTAGPGRPLGQVYEQSPAAGQVTAIGATVRLTVYAGEGAVPSWVGLNITDACNRVTAAGYVCQAVEGVTAVGSGQPPGTVYAQDPVSNTVLPVGGTVRLTYYSGNNALPSYNGVEVGAACADVAARGFQCQPVAQLHPTTNTVFGQNPAPGNHPIGSVVQVAYSPWATAEFSIYRHRSLNVWVLRPTGQIPGDYGEPSYRVGRAYPANTRFPGARAINGFYCASGEANCSGLSPNHFYTAAGSYANPNWAGPNEIAVFMPCDVPGGRGIYRTWTDRGGIRYYGITDNPPGGVTGQELLGCVW